MIQCFKAFSNTLGWKDPDSRKREGRNIEARAQLLCFVVSLINLNDSVSFLEIRESKSKDGNQILCHSSVFCFKTTSIHWTGNTDTPTERTGAVIIGVIIECVTKKALTLTTDQGSHWNRILLIAFAGTVS